MRNETVVCFIAAVCLCAGPVFAQDAGMEHKEMDHSEMDHSKMQEPGKTQATGTGVINTVDIDKKSINITHEPMPELGWPTMTMDLDVTKKVDLSPVKEGDKVNFKLKLGRDKKYRVIEIKPSQ